MNNELIKIKDLKEIDKKILGYLIKDSKKSLSEIAAEIETTRQNISLRIKKLKEKKIIDKFTIDLDNSQIEELQVKAYILFREDPNSQIRKEDEATLIKIPQITQVSRLFGKYDGIIEAIAKTNQEITDIIREIHSLKGIKETETFIVHTNIKDDDKSPILNLL